MEQDAPLVLLTTVTGTFHGRVLTARLGSEGVLAQTRPFADGLYPLATVVEVLVRADQLEIAREILLADAVDAAFAEPWPRAGRRREVPRRWLRRRGAP
jgi:hypothetical protein